MGSVRVVRVDRTGPRRRPARIETKLGRVWGDQISICELLLSCGCDWGYIQCASRNSEQFYRRSLLADV